MKRIIILFTAFLSLAMTGCSYVTDMIEAGMTERASFSIDASFNGTDVALNWDTVDTDTDFFAGIEVFRTSAPDDEYADYELIANRFTSGPLEFSTTDTFTYAITGDPDAPLHGTYFYRVAIIYWLNPPADRDSGHGYTGTLSTDYNAKTHIESISGYAKVVIP